MITNSFRIAAPESAIERHDMCFNRDTDNRLGATEQDATELLISLALWAEVNGLCLRIPKPVYADEVGGA